MPTAETTNSSHDRGTPPGAPPGRGRPVLAWLLSPVVPLALMAVLALGSMAHKSATFDEPLMLAAGTWYLRTGNMSLNAENPPLFKALYSLPCLAFHDPALPPLPENLRFSYNMLDEFAYANDFLFKCPQHRQILFLCRLVAVGCGLLLGFVLYCVTRRIWDNVVAGLMLWVFALCPNVLTHTQLVTMDIGCALTVFLTTIALAQLLRTGQRRWLVGCGMALGCALLTKFTAVLLVPILAIQALVWLAPREHRNQAGRVLLRLLGTLTLALLLVSAAYRFDGLGHRLRSGQYESQLLRRLQTLPGIAAVPLPVPEAYIRGFDIVAYNNEPGLPNIFLGKYYPKGASWWYYYIVVIGLKTPVPFLLGLAGSLVLLLRQRDRNWSTVLVLALPPVLLFANFSFLAYRQLGFRYILPLWPFALLLLGVGIARLRGLWADRRVRAVGWGLGVWYAASTVLAYPHFLSYFNELAGGSRNGWKYLADSNIDWGQDLPALATWQEQNGHPPMYVLYYGTAPLAAYGVAEQAWATFPLPQYLAVSVTSLYVLESVPLVKYLREERSPLARLGNSIFIYELDQAVRERFMRLATESTPGRPTTR